MSCPCCPGLPESASCLARPNLPSRWSSEHPTGGRPRWPSPGGIFYPVPIVLVALVVPVFRD